MPRLFNFTRAANQVLPENARSGWVLKLLDPMGAKDGSVIDGRWEAILLSDVVANDITDEQQRALASKLKITESAGWVFTGDKILESKKNVRIVIEGPGDIQLWDAVRGDWVIIIDPLKRLETHGNVVHAAPGYTIGLGQFKEGVTAGQSLNLSSEGSGFHGGALYLVCDGKNWLISFLGVIGEPGGPVPDPKPVITWVRDFISTENLNVVELLIRG